MEKLLTIREVAELLSCTWQTVYLKIKEGDIPHLRIGKGIRIERADLEKYIRMKKET